MMTHAGRSTHRGGLKLEVYNNTFTSNIGFIWPALIRSGTGVIFNNIVSGNYVTKNYLIDNQRTCLASFGPRCDGNSAKYDGNTPGEYGWPCEGQIGRGGGAWGRQTSVPLYAWNNGSIVIAVNSNFDLCLSAPPPILSDHIKATAHSNGEVDYANNGSTPRPGYTPYTYPHPLRRPAPPQNL